MTTANKQLTLTEIPRDKLSQMQRNLEGYSFSDGKSHFFRNRVEVAEQVQLVRSDEVSPTYVSVPFSAADNLLELYEKAMFRKDLKSQGVSIDELGRAKYTDSVRTTLGALEELK